MVSHFYDNNNNNNKQQQQQQIKRIENLNEKKNSIFKTAKRTHIIIILFYPRLHNFFPGSSAQDQSIYIFNISAKTKKLFHVEMH